MAQRIDFMVKHRDLQDGPYRSFTLHDMVLASVRLDQVRAPSRLGRVELEPVAESPGAFADP